jgi:hypothetical protein
MWFRSSNNKPKEAAAATISADQKPPVVVCENCQPQSQQPLPSADRNASQGGPCHALYLHVDQCMRAHRQQVTKCNDQWQAFRVCREDEKRTRKPPPRA